MAAAAILQGMTAHYLAHDSYPIQQGDWVVVHAAAGGVGLLLTQLAKLRGGRVIATTSTEEKAALAREAGADEVIGYDGFAQRVKEISGEGAAAVYDGVGKATFLDGFDALRPFGRMILYGAASGRPDPLDTAILAPKGSLYVQRPTLMTYTRTPELLRELAGRLFELIADGKLDVRIGARYPLDQAAQAHRDLEARKTTGKLLLIPSRSLPRSAVRERPLPGLEVGLGRAEQERQRLTAAGLLLHVGEQVGHQAVVRDAVGVEVKRARARDLARECDLAVV